jgi:hypothetical protein
MDTVKVVEIQSEYKLIGENIYLPKETVINFEYAGSVPSGIEKTIGEKHQFGNMKTDTSEKKMSGSISLKFSDYKVNKGIEDTFFEEGEEKD